MTLTTEMSTPPRLAVVGISGSPSTTSKSRVLLEHTLERFRQQGATTELIDLAALPADALLGRSASPEVERARALVADARVVVASTPVYRANYSGLLKVFFDLLAPGSLAGKIGIAIATGGVPGHLLVLDHGLQPLFSSLGAVVVPTGTFGTDAEFEDGRPSPVLLERLDRATVEAQALASAGHAEALHSIPTV